MQNCIVAELYSCRKALSQSGIVAEWPGCIVAWLQRCKDAELHADIVAWLKKCRAANLHRNKVRRHNGKKAVKSHFRFSTFFYQMEIKVKFHTYPKKISFGVSNNSEMVKSAGTWFFAKNQAPTKTSRRIKQNFLASELKIP